MAEFPIEELRALRHPERLIRIAPQTDVPITPRIARLIDTDAFQRLRRVSQLGLVSLVYPAATHSRFEHSLGVYHNALAFVERLLSDAIFRQCCDSQSILTLLIASLLHDVGHYPYAHLIEDIEHSAWKRHEELAETALCGDELSNVLKCDFGVEPVDVLNLLTGRLSNDGQRLAGSILSGPIDIDKLDYLRRDSMHAGVPYGQNFDSSRLISQLCVDAEHMALAVTDKAVTAAEMMVFARYVMFREVYWHHAVRSATVMLQRIVFMQDDAGGFQSQAAAMSDEAMQQQFLQADNAGSRELANRLFGPRRRLHKRLAEFDAFREPDLHNLLAARGYAVLAQLSDRLAEELSTTGQPIAPGMLLIDAPPRKVEVQFRLRVRGRDGFRSLENLSPFVRTLANEQFDLIVKRVRIFVADELRPKLTTVDIARAIERVL